MATLDRIKNLPCKLFQSRLQGLFCVQGHQQPAKGRVKGMGVPDTPPTPLHLCPRVLVPKERVRRGNGRGARRGRLPQGSILGSATFPLVVSSKYKYSSYTTVPEMQAIIFLTMLISLILAIIFVINPIQRFKVWSCDLSLSFERLVNV